MVTSPRHCVWRQTQTFDFFFFVLRSVNLKFSADFFHFLRFSSSFELFFAMADTKSTVTLFIGHSKNSKFMEKHSSSQRILQKNSENMKNTYSIFLNILIFNFNIAHFFQRFSNSLLSLAVSLDQFTEKELLNSTSLVLVTFAHKNSDVLCSDESG